jgi:diguanylate cyclase (GGDEF)-like protein/PAS domain S-box-containing protein
MKPELQPAFHAPADRGGQLRATSLFARGLLDACPDPMLIVDMRRRITDINRAVEDMTGCGRGRIIGTDLLEWFTQGEVVADLVLRALHEGQVCNHPLAVRHRSGRLTEVLCSVTIHRDHTRTAVGAFIAARDVTELRQYETQVSFQATCDALTALPNRLLFRERLSRAIKRADSRSISVGLMFIDLDNFKDINDTLGHAVGDELLKGTANRLADVLRTTETAARMGGDEFAIMVEDASDPAAMAQLANKLREVIAWPHYIEGREVTITCSIGITRHPLDGSGVDTLLSNADAAMYRAKEEGRNTFRHFSPEMNGTIRRRLDISNCLRRAIRIPEFSLHFQPRAELAGGRLVGVETLLRWQSADLGTVPPSEFIPVAENNGLIVPIGEWVLYEACRQAAQWRHTTAGPLNVAVNLSARQFRDTDIVRTVSRVLESTGLPASMLELELTESALMHDVERVSHTLDRLKEIGVRIAVDDFGTGYSSLSYLKSFPLDYLKIDRSFINDIPHDANDRAIVRAIIAMAHSLGIKVIAEGVETTEQLEFLADLHCDEVQGYLLCKPAPARELEAGLRGALRLKTGKKATAGTGKRQRKRQVPPSDPDGKTKSS